MSECHTHTAKRKDREKERQTDVLMDLPGRTITTHAESLPERSIISSRKGHTIGEERGGPPWRQETYTLQCMYEPFAVHTKQNSHVSYCYWGDLKRHVALSFGASKGETVDRRTALQKCT